MAGSSKAVGFAGTFASVLDNANKIAKLNTHVPANHLDFI
jgi:hypothetical protein